MKCLTSEEIQTLIDGEIPFAQSEQYQQHIETCSHCLERYNNKKELAHFVKDLINASVKSPERIPEFQIPKNSFNARIKNYKIPVWAKIAALLIPVFFIWKLYNKPEVNFKPTAENIRMYEMCNNVDDNTAFQENMIVTTVSDKNGSVIECKIIN